MLKYENAFCGNSASWLRFIPMLMDTGGNSGSQSEHDDHPWYGGRRGRTGGYSEGYVEGNPRGNALLDLSLALVNFVRLMIQYPGNRYSSA